MLDLIHMGGPLFTWPLVLLLIAILVLAGLAARDVARGTVGAATNRRMDAVMHLGVFSAVFGILGQALGLYQALQVIEQVGGVSPALLAGGLKVSFVATLFGLVNLVVALATWSALRWSARRAA